MQIAYCVANNELVACSLRNGEVHVYDVNTKILIRIFTLNDQKVEDLGSAFVQLSINSEHLVAVSNHGDISVWKISDEWILIYNTGMLCDAKSLHKGSIQGVKIYGNIFITGDTKGLWNIFRIMDKKVELIRSEILEYDGHTSPINHIDFDGSYILIATNEEIILFSMEGGVTELNETIRFHALHISTCCLQYPFAVTSSLRSPGLKIWDLRSGELSNTLLEHSSFYGLDLKNGILVAPVYFNINDIFQLVHNHVLGISS